MMRKLGFIGNDEHYPGGVTSLITACSREAELADYRPHHLLHYPGGVAFSTSGYILTRGEKATAPRLWFILIGISEGSAVAGTPGYLRSNPSGVVTRRGERRGCAVAVSVAVCVAVSVTVVPSRSVSR